VTSELGRGTTITLLWPRAEPAVSEESAGTAPLPSGQGQVILLVDDDPSVRLALGKNLKRAGFKVIEASDTDSGIEILRRGKLDIDALCTDWMMPGRPVRHLIDEFQRVHGGPVLVSSGYAPAETGISPSVISDFIAKPFSGDELVRRLHRLLSLPAADPQPAAPAQPHA
jgi:DNA-binding response OmpR family regulator